MQDDKQYCRLSESSFQQTQLNTSADKINTLSQW